MPNEQSNEKPIAISIRRVTNEDGLRFQVLEFELMRPDRVLYPADLREIELPDNLDTTMGIVLSGRGPIWLYGYLLHLLHPTPWVACFEPRKKAGIVVAAHTGETTVGQEVSVPEVIN